MEVITITTQKGGTGKTTTAHAMGAGLIRYYGKRVLLLDLDAQGNLTRTMEADRSGTAGRDSFTLITGTASAVDCIQRTEHGDIIGASPLLAGADAAPELSKVGREYRLKKALEPLSGMYDYCIIDTPPALSILTVNALTACRKVIIPAQADDYSLDSLTRLRETLDTVREYCNPSLQVDGILLTRHNTRTVLSRELTGLITQAAEDLQTRVYTARIREAIAIREAQAMRQDIFAYAPRSGAAQDYRAFVAEFMEGGRKNA